MSRNHRNDIAQRVAQEPQPERIAKLMARAGLCSRRTAEDWIAAGRVSVNGSVIASPALRVLPSDAVRVDDRPLPQRERTRLFLYHKPRGVVTSAADPEGRPTVFDALPAALPRLISVGRLDITSEGLLLLTNDGGLARILELPKTGWLRRYRVRAHGTVSQAQLDALSAGLTVAGVRYGPIQATLDRQQGRNVWLTVGIREGKNREIRAIAAALGLQVNRLIRISFGPFELGDLPPGGLFEVRTCTLREQLGQKIAAAAGANFTAPLITATWPKVKDRMPGQPPSLPRPGTKATRESASAQPGAATADGRQRPQRRVRSAGMPKRAGAPKRPRR